MSLGLNNFDQAKALSDQTAEFQKKIRALEAELAAAKQEKNDWKIASQTNAGTIKLLSDRIDVYINRIADVWVGETNIEGIRADERRTRIEEVAAWLHCEGMDHLAGEIRAKFLSTPSSEAPHD